MAVRNKALIALGVHCGARISELLSLQVKDVFDGRRMKDRITFQKRNMKGQKKSRTVPLHEQAKAMLLPLCGVPGARPLFRHGDDVTPLKRSGAFKILKQGAKKAELPDLNRISPHALRKTFARKQYDYHKHDLIATQAAMGHSNVNSTRAYLDVEMEHVDKGILEQKSF